SATSASVAYKSSAMLQQTIISSVPNASQDSMVLPQNHQTSGMPAAPSNRLLNSSASLFALTKQLNRMHCLVRVVDHSPSTTSMNIGSGILG
ncbi:5437_t:CDS:1, partial [Paraglomus brasilianum]